MALGFPSQIPGTNVLAVAWPQGLRGVTTSGSSRQKWARASERPELWASPLHTSTYPKRKKEKSGDPSIVQTLTHTS